MPNASFSQLTCNASSDSGSGYPVILSSGLDYETPDCIHSDFGAHVTQIFDPLLNKNVFEFHSHIIEDNDRCQVDDRVRMEIKGGPGTSNIAQHDRGSTSYYRWKFKLPSDFKGASSFCHLFQNKTFGGNDSGFPVITITARSEVMEVIHNGGDTGVALGRLVATDLNLFLGKWVEVYIKQVHDEEGELKITFRDLVSGDVFLEYENPNIDLWRSGGEYARPKWGVYRSKNDVLKDEIVRFADFCISESEETLCPSEAILIQDNEAPTVPMGLSAENIMIHSVDLFWLPSTDNIGVAEYILFQDSMEVWRGSEHEVSILNLLGSTSYQFQIAAKDHAGNTSEYSEPLEVITDDSTALPGMAINPIPEDGASGVILSPQLSWVPGENIDSSFVYLGSNNSLEQVGKTTGSTFVLENLNEDTQYFWQIGSWNENGETLSDIWTFTTGTEGEDGPWKVYRAVERLDVETSFYVPLDIPDDPDFDDILVDPNGSGNTFYGYHESGEEKFRWRYEFSEEDTAFTVVARVKALSEEINCICYFEVKAFGWREKVRLNQSTIKLERSSPLVEEEWPFDIVNEFHIIRMTMKDTEVKIYLDEDPEPFAIGNSDTEAGGFNFEWGKSGGNECGGVIDWMAIHDNVAYAPAEGPELPEDLFLSSDARLSSIFVNGDPLDGFHTDTLVYNVEESDEVPVLEVQTVSDFASVEIINPSTVPGSLAMIRVTAQDGFVTRNYEINYTMSTATNDEIDFSFQVFPNPVVQNLNVNYDKQGPIYINLIDLTGKVILRQEISHHSQINMSNLIPGTYFLQINLKDKNYYKKIVRL